MEDKPEENNKIKPEEKIRRGSIVKDIKIRKPKQTNVDDKDKDLNNINKTPKNDNSFLS